MHEGGTNHPDLRPDPVPGRTRLPLGDPDRIKGRKSVKTMRPGPFSPITGFPGVMGLSPNDGITAGPLNKKPVPFRVHLPVRHGYTPARHADPEILLYRDAGGRAGEKGCFSS